MSTGFLLRHRHTIGWYIDNSNYDGRGKFEFAYIEELELFLKLYGLEL